MLADSGGIVYRRGHEYRLMPDLLGDYIIETSCVGVKNQLTAFAEQLFELAPMSLVSHVLADASRLD